MIDVIHPGISYYQALLYSHHGQRRRVAQTNRFGKIRICF